MLCERCGKTHAETARFCSDCGARLTQAPGAPGSPHPISVSDTSVSPGSLSPGSVSHGSVYPPAPAADSFPAASPAADDARRTAAERLLASAEAAQQAHFSREAEQITREALFLDPASIRGHSLLAGILEERGNRAGALAERQELARLNPGSGPAPSWRRRLAGSAVQSSGHRLPLVLMGAASVIFAVAWWLLVSMLTKPQAPAAPGARASAASPSDLMASASPAVSGPGAQAGSPAGALDQNAIPAGGQSLTGSAAPLNAPAPGASDGQNAPAPLVDGRSYTTYRTFAGPGASYTGSPANTAATPRAVIRRPEALPVTLPPIAAPRGAGSRQLQAGAGFGAGPAFTAAPPRVDMTEDAALPRPQGYAAALQQARASFQSGDYNAAIPEYRQALHSAPDVLATARVRQELGMTYTFMNQPREARGEFNAAEQLYSSQLQGPNADVARRGLDDVRAQLELPENRE